MNTVLLHKVCWTVFPLLIFFLLIHRMGWSGKNEQTSSFTKAPSDWWADAYFVIYAAISIFIITFSVKWSIVATFVAFMICLNIYGIRLCHGSLRGFIREEGVGMAILWSIILGSAHIALCKLADTFFNEDEENDDGWGYDEVKRSEGGDNGT